MSSALYDPIKTHAKMTDSVIVGFSGGKDSIVTLDLCCRYFKHVAAYELYTTPNLSWQERCFCEYERRYNIHIERLPNVCVAHNLKYGIYTVPDANVPIITLDDIYAYMRKITGYWWIAGGERASDSIERHALINKIGSADYDAGRFYPICYWKTKEILNYIKVRKLPYYNMREGWDARSLIEIQACFPQDWDKIHRLYPFLNVEIIGQLRKIYPNGKITLEFDRRGKNAEK